MTVGPAVYPAGRPWLGRRALQNPLVRACAQSRSAQIGLTLVTIILVLAFVGPLARPSSPTAIVGAPFEGPSSSHWLGTDVLGRDVVSRYLSGGLTLILVAFAATALAYLIGVTIGMIAGFRRDLFDLASVAVIDVVLAVPPIIIVLALLAAVGPKLWLIIVAIGGVFTPRIARIVRSVTIEVSAADFVEAAVARGERLRAILYRDIFRNITLPLSADVGIRISGAIILFSSLSYLGLGQPPPASDWGVMVSENRAGLIIQPWVVLVPAITIAALAVGMNLIADAVARAMGRSIVSRDA